MKIGTAFATATAAFALGIGFAAPGFAQGKGTLLEEETIYIESTRTTQPSLPPPVVVQQQAPPVVIERQAPPVVIEKQSPPVVIEKQSPPVVIERSIERAAPQPIREGQLVSLSGRIIDIDGDDFTIDVNGTRVKVDTDDLRSDPIDEGRLGRGDMVTVHGRVDYVDHSGVKLNAQSIDVAARSQTPQTVR
jgi:hypothetical protein